MLSIVSFNIRRVMIDQGSGAEMIYLDLYKGLGLTPEDITYYDTPLVTFDGTIVTPARKIRLAVEVTL